MTRTGKPQFDFESLRPRIVVAARAVLRDFELQHPKESICAFGLYSDEDAITVCPSLDTVTRRDARLAKYPDDVENNKFETAEWAFEAFGGEHFTTICKELYAWVSAHPDADRAFADRIYETCLEALEELRDEKAFGPTAPMLRFAVSDFDIELAVEVERMERLNGGSPDVSEYRRWAEAWG